MQADEISAIVADVLKRLKEHGNKPGMVCFDFTGSHALPITLVQKMLNERGFIALIALGHRASEDVVFPVRMYVDSSKRNSK